ncbi:MAG TPA: glycosyltransferase family 4 protein [Gallionellaceae bacterium]|nr:glycosyltransferase family 4 protein [Gallionellaceae bacterium]
MTSRKKVLVLTSTFPRWVGDKEPPFVFELCRRLDGQFDVLVLAPHADGAKCSESMAGIDVVRFRYFFARWERLAYQGGILANLKRSRWCYLLLPFFFISQLAALWRILRHQRIDAIHAHWIIPQGLTVAIVGLLIKNMPPWICTSHGGDLLGLNGWLLNRIKRWVIRSSSLLTVVSKAVADCALSLGAKTEQLRTISMGVDTRERFSPSTTSVCSDNELLFVGRLVEKKGVTYLLDAMPEIIRQCPGVHLSVVGNGPEENALKQQADRLGIAHAVTFLGSLNNSEIPELYRRATVFVAPSIVTVQGDQEGLGLVLVEALACECPVVASDLLAIRDVVVHEDTGFLVPQKSPEAIVSAVVTLLAKPELRRQLAIKGRDHVIRNFDWSIVASRYAALIGKLVEQ